MFSFEHLPCALERSTKGQVVLIIDDEPSVRMLVMELLNEAGLGAVEAADGPSGLRVLQAASRIDLLITDVGLPGGMNGRQVADAARSARPGHKVLFIAGYAENAVVGNGHLEKGDGRRDEAVCDGHLGAQGPGNARGLSVSQPPPTPMRATALPKRGRA
jgi:CheY-like chemotaxis protein